MLTQVIITRMEQNNNGKEPDHIATIQRNPKGSRISPRLRSTRWFDPNRNADVKRHDRMASRPDIAAELMPLWEAGPCFHVLIYTAC